MSMRDYAVDDYGLVLNTNHLQCLASRALDDYSEEEWENGRLDIVQELVETLNIECISEFRGEAFVITNVGESDWSNTDIYNGDSIYYIGISVYPSLFKQAYSDMDELILEFKKKIGKYLPDNFDYRSNIRHIVGTYFG